jgi:hypothetical protein
MRTIPTAYTVSLFPPAFSYFWQFNPFIAFFNPTFSFTANGIELTAFKDMTFTPKA